MKKANPEPKTQNHKGDGTKSHASKETVMKSRPPTSSQTGIGKAAKAMTLNSQKLPPKEEWRNKSTKKRNGEAEGRGDQPAKRKNKGGRDGEQPTKKGKAVPEPPPPTE